jgi:hypothetical protein
MKRREFITLLGGAAAAWPLAARAQQAAIPIVGFLSTNQSAAVPHFTAAFREGLAEAGFIDGKNVTIEFRFAEQRLERVPATRIFDDWANGPQGRRSGLHVRADDCAGCAVTRQRHSFVGGC